MSFRSLTSLLFTAFLCSLTALRAQQPTIGLMQAGPGSYGGYTLFAPNGAPDTYLIDPCGRVVNQWTSDYSPALSAYLLEDGSLLRACRLPGQSGAIGGGIIERRAWDNTLTWNYTYSGANYRQHHDIKMLPNGNVLLLARENKTQADCIAAGRNPALVPVNGLVFEYMVEVQPIGSDSGNIVWEWHFWDHLVQDFDSTKANYGVVADHPELLDMNASTGPVADWLHCNSVAYNEALDQIIINSRNQNEFYIVDHNTSTAEAASHTGGAHGRGGDFLYRWGNPANYGRGTVSDQQLWVQHDAHWIADGLSGAGNILIFNNGDGRPQGQYSTVVEITPPVDGNGDYPLAAGQAWGPATHTWVYQAPNPTDFYSFNISGSQRLPNGNTLICEGANGRLFEVNPQGNINWEYIVPLSAGVPMTQGDNPTFNATFRCYRYGVDYAAFALHTPVPGDPIELNPLPPTASCLALQTQTPAEIAFSLWPNPAYSDFNLSVSTPSDWQLISPQGQTLRSGTASAGTHTLSTAGIAPGIYFLRITSGTLSAVKTVAIE